MSNFEMPDLDAITSALDAAPIDLPQSDKGRFFNFNWWPIHYKEVEGPVLKAIKRKDDPTFDRRVNIMRIAERVDAKNGEQLLAMGFTPSEITRYVTRAMNKRLRQIARGSDTYFVIRNEKLTSMALEHKPAA